jgi:hypothetical protein
MNPEIFTLSLIEWLFATLTFKSVKLTDAVRIKMFFALMRIQAGNFGIHFKKTIWCLRSERGESTGREHLHALIAGFQSGHGRGLEPVINFCERSIEHEYGEGDPMVTGHGGGQSFVVTRQPAKARGPGKGSFHHPSSRQQHESFFGLMVFAFRLTNRTREFRSGKILRTIGTTAFQSGKSWRRIRTLR